MRRSDWAVGAGIILASMAGLTVATGAEPLLQATFENGAAGWERAGKASVSTVTRRPGTRSLLLQQGTNVSDAAGYWLSPAVTNPGQPLKLTFWAADNYLRCPDLSYSACIDLVSLDAAGNVIEQSLGMIQIPWDDGRKDSLWGQKLPEGLTWTYFERLIRPQGKTFRVKFRWPKPMARGDCYLTDLVISAADPAEMSAAAALPAAADEAAASTPFGLELLPTAHGSLYYATDPLRFDVLLYAVATNVTDVPADGRLAYEITDFQRFFVARGRVELGDLAMSASTNVPAVGRGKDARPYLRRVLTVDDPKARAVGRELFIETQWIRDGRIAASDTVPYGVVDPHPVPVEEYTNCHFVIGYFDAARPKQGTGEKMGACWSTRYEYGGWKEQQPVEGGPIAFKEKLPSFPRLIWCPNLEQIRGRPDDHPWGSVPTMAPGWAVEPDPRTPATKTFKIDAYVAYMVAFIRQHREAIGMVVPSGLERNIDARTIELQKKAYTAIKREFPDLPVGMMLYGVPMNPSTDITLFLKEKLYEFADFINDDIYSPAVDWTEWKRLRTELERLGRRPLPLTATEFARVGGTDQVQKSRDMIASQLDGFAQGLTLVHYWNMPGRAADPYLREPPPGDGFMFVQEVDRKRHGGTTWMPLLPTLTYHNLVRNLETAAYRQTFHPDANCIGYRFERKGQTIMAVWLTQPLGQLAYAVEVDAPFTAQDLFGRTERLTPVHGAALISVDDTPLTLVFDRPVDGAVIRPVKGGVARTTLARGSAGDIAVDVPGVFRADVRLAVDGTVDGAWPVIPSQTIEMKAGQSASLRVKAAIDADRAVGAYPITFRLRDGDRLAGLLKGELKVDEVLSVDVVGLPWTRGARPAVQVTIRNLQARESSGTVAFEDRHFAGTPRPVVAEAPYRAKAGETTVVQFPIDPDLVTLPASYPVAVDVRDASGITVKKAEEVSFLACERAPGPLAIDGDLKDWNLAARMAVPFERKHTDWGKDIVSPEDLGGVFYSAWDSSNLYFAVVLRDDVQINRANDVGIWMDDNIMFGFYPWGWKLDEHVNSGYYREHLGLCGDGTARVFRIGAAPGGPVTAEGVQIAVKTTGTGYVYEWAYPRASLSPVDLKGGGRFRLSMWVWDRDDLKGKLGGIQTGGFNSVVDARPTKWREFVMTE